MDLLKTICRHEWRQLCRQRWMLSGLILFIFIALLAIGVGNQAVHSKFTQIDSMKVSFDQDIRNTIQKLGDTSTPKGKGEAKNAGLAAMINYRLSPTAIKKPLPLSALSLGLMDVQPWYQQIKFTRNFNDQNWAPITNPMMMLAGNFDYSFVLVYLLPMLVLSFCYSIYSAEVEAGTLSLLAIQGSNVKLVIRLKLLFRFLLLGSILTLLNIIGFLLVIHKTDYTLGMLIGWMLITWLYLFFWIAIAYLALSLKKAAMVTALYLASTWLLLLIVIPSVVNSYIQVKYPLPLQDEIASFRRHQSEEIWAGSPKLLSDSFNRYNPQYASSINPAKDTLPHSLRYVAGYYYLLERRMNRKMKPFNQQVDLRNRTAQKLLRWNPVFLCESGLNTISGNQLYAFQDFNEQANKYQLQWQGFLYPFHFAEKRLTSADLSVIPVFNYRPPIVFDINVILAIVYIFMLSCIILVMAVLIERKHSFIKL
ncbi:ABC transporter permease subunit [Chitinophaga sancti]|uniref:ABC transporter permease subunit n=1 Tax=Chitinophaga sancti TaxID=1004 RepID=UPI002A756A2E|nr:ABC transporter permease subunit [Chitinophaga sancti]WPQ62637.1 ABC transporter permease subunit [Chitinophaga sancti]